MEDWISQRLTVRSWEPVRRNEGGWSSGDLNADEDCGGVCFGRDIAPRDVVSNRQAGRLY